MPMNNNDHDDFIKTIFSKKPEKEKYMKIKLDPPPPNLNITIYEFEQILQIFTDGLHYKFSNNGNKINLDNLNIEDIDLMEKYMNSLSYQFYIDRFTSPSNYVEKLPNYLEDKEKYTDKDKIKLKDVYFQIATFHDKNKTNIKCIYRISFDNID